MPYEIQKETRKIIIDVILNTDISKHFTLLTELKTKLGNNFPTEALEDRTLIMSLTLRTASNFKVIRDRNTFFKWMEKMFEEFYKQGDMEKTLELPISKFMDRENSNKENFPFLNCDKQKYNIEYNGNLYQNFFYYPKPQAGRDFSY